MLKRLSLDEWKQHTSTFDQHVQATPDISHVCTASDWQYAAYQTLHSQREAAIWTSDECSFLGCSGELPPFTRVLQPLEISWAFGSSVVGADPVQCADFVLSILEQHASKWQVVMLSGVPRGSQLQRQLQRKIGRYYRMDAFEGAHCMQSLLSDGLDAFLGGLSSKFRANLRRSERRASEQGIQFEWHDRGLCAESILQRALDIETRSWKFADGSSIFQTDRFLEFYRKLSQSMAQNGRLRALFATQEGRDIAYVLGGTLGRVYRGFQLSYDDSYAALGIGHLAQWKMIQKLVGSDNIHTYDLGMMMDYKKKWSNHLLQLDNLIIFLGR